MDSLKQQIEKKAICGRSLDNEPTPMEGCNLIDCDRCEVRSKVAQYIFLDDVLGLLADCVCIPRKQLQEDYDKALAEPSDEMDKLENVCMLIQKLLGKEKP